MDSVMDFQVAKPMSNGQNNRKPIFVQIRLFIRLFNEIVYYVQQLV